MIRAVFFDWFNTLARYEPPRENLHSQALRELGIDVSPEQLLPGVLAADRGFFEENSISPVRTRSPEEQAGIFTRYQETVLKKAGLNVSHGSELTMSVMKKVQELSRGMRFALFDDVLPALKALKEQDYVLGLLTNFDKDMAPICRELGLEPYLNFTVTSGEVGADKPDPPIFLTALKRADVDASEAVHVGDQYKVDIVGARAVGIAPILIDRYDQPPEGDDCPRITSLPELIEYLN